MMVLAAGGANSFHTLALGPGALLNRWMAASDQERWHLVCPTSWLAKRKARVRRRLVLEVSE